MRGVGLCVVPRLCFVVERDSFGHNQLGRMKDVVTEVS